MLETKHASSEKVVKQELSVNVTDGQIIIIIYCTVPQMTGTHGSWNTTNLFIRNNWRILASEDWWISPYFILYGRHNSKVRITIIYSCTTKHTQADPLQYSEGCCYSTYLNAPIFPCIPPPP